MENRETDVNERLTENYTLRYIRHNKFITIVSANYTLMETYISIIECLWIIFMKNVQLSKNIMIKRYKEEEEPVNQRLESG